MPTVKRPCQEQKWKIQNTVEISEGSCWKWSGNMRFYVTPWCRIRWHFCVKQFYPFSQPETKINSRLIVCINLYSSNIEFLGVEILFSFDQPTVLQMENDMKIIHRTVFKKGCPKLRYIFSSVKSCPWKLFLPPWKVFVHKFLLSKLITWNKIC